MPPLHSLKDFVLAAVTPVVPRLVERALGLAGRPVRRDGEAPSGGGLEILGLRFLPRSVGNVGME